MKDLMKFICFGLILNQVLLTAVVYPPLVLPRPQPKPQPQPLPVKDDHHDHDFGSDSKSSDGVLSDKKTKNGI